MSPPLILSISPAEPPDAESLGEIMLRAMEPHMIDRFMVPEEDFPSAYAAKMKWFLSEYSPSLSDPSKRLFKAMVKGTGEIVGFAAIEYDDGLFEATAESTEQELALEPAVAALPAEKKTGFAQYYFGQSRAVRVKHMRRIKHVVWTTLHVKPAFQGKGVGSALLRWGFKEYDLEKELVWINTQMRGRNIYRRFGWEDVDHLDVDLSVWGGKLRGFGIHRTPFLLRQPGEFKKLDGFTDE